MEGTLHWADYLIFALFLVASLGIGFYHACTGNKQRTTQEFLMADRNLRVLPTTLSLLVSFQSALMILGFSAEIYSYGTRLWFGSLLGYAIALLTAERIFVPWMFPLKLTSVYEYLHLRFQSRATRILGSVLGALGGLLYIGPAMYAPSIALEAATGFPTTMSIPIMTVVATTYTALGGMRAVIWTDVFQAGIMVCGLLAVLIKGLVEVGGFGQAFELASSEGRVVGIDFTFDPRERLTVWSMSIGFGSLWAFIYGLQQAALQRYSATGSLRAARLSILLNLPALFFLVSLSFCVGIVVSAYFIKQGCDPLLNGDITTSNQILPLMVKTLFASNNGFSGLFLATLYSGALSSVSSSLSGCAANVWEDILKHHIGHISEFRAAIVNKIMVILFGAVGAGVAFLAAAVPGPVTQVSMAFSGATGGPLCGLFILGGISTSINWQGALLGCIVGVVMSLTVVFGSQTIPPFTPSFPPFTSDNCTSNVTELTTITHNATIIEPTFEGIENLFAMSYLWYGLFGSLCTITVGFTASKLISLAFPSTRVGEVDSKLLIPWRAMFTFSTMPKGYDAKEEVKERNDVEERETMLVKSDNKTDNT